MTDLEIFQERSCGVSGSWTPPRITLWLKHEESGIWSSSFWAAPNVVLAVTLVCSVYPTWASVLSLKCQKSKQPALTLWCRKFENIFLRADRVGRARLELSISVSAVNVHRCRRLTEPLCPLTSKCYRRTHNYLQAHAGYFYLIYFSCHKQVLNQVPRLRWHNHNWEPAELLHRPVGLL